jgi:OOP family OmpA-OmpF porin
MKLARNLVAVLVVGIFSISGACHAQIPNNGFYLGAGGGGVKYNGFNELCRNITGALPGQPVSTSCDSDETVFGFKFFGGWRWNQHLALEGGYANLGEGKGDTVIFGQNVNGEISANALFIELIVSVPLSSKARLFGKLGYASISADLKTDLFAVPLAATPATSFGKTYAEPVYGAGFEYGFTEKVAGRLEWERFDFEDGIDFFTLNIVFYPGKSGN